MVCHTCRENIAGYESVHYGSLETGYRDLCSRCFNEELRASAASSSSMCNSSPWR